MRAPSLQALSRLALLLALVVTLPACDSTEEEGGDDPGGLFTQAAANKGTWNFIQVAGAVCRNGSPTGFGVRLQEGATNTMIFLEGGGACFNEFTCAGNPSTFGATEFEARKASLTGGIFSTDSSNPVGDWNAVYVPYCTGDVHGGSAPNTTIPTSPSVGVQQFVGHDNIEKYLALLGPYLGNPDKVLLTGESAGGFGTLTNFPVVDQTFSQSMTYLLDDSGPIFFSDDVLSPPLSNSIFGLYRLDLTLPGAFSVAQTDGLQNIYGFLSTTYPDSRFALASHLEDQTIRGFFGFGQPGDPRTAITGAEYAAGLRDLRGRLPSQWGTYYATGAGHTFLRNEYTSSSAGVTLSAYVGSLVNGTVSNVDPAGTSRPALASR